MTENGAMKISCDAIINGFCSAAPPVRIPADEAPRSLVHSEAPPSLIHSDAPPPSLIHSDAPPPSLIHSDAPPPSLIHSDAPPPSLIHSDAPPPSLIHSDAPPPSLIHSDAPPPSLIQSEAPPPSLVRSEAPPPSLIQSEAPPPSLVHSEAPPPSLVLFCFAAPPAGGLHGDPSPDLAPPSVHDALPSSAVADDLSEEEVVATYFLDIILEVIAVELDDPEALAILHLMAQIAEAEEAPTEILSLGFSIIPVRQSRDMETWVPTLSAPAPV